MKQVIEISDNEERILPLKRNIHFVFPELETKNLEISSTQKFCTNMNCLFIHFNFVKSSHTHDTHDPVKICNAFTSEMVAFHR